MDVAIRLVVAGLILGLPSYWLGMEVYAGRVFSKTFLRLSGFAIYGAFVLLIASIWVSIAAAICLALILGVLGAYFMPEMPKWQARFRGVIKENRS